MEKAGWVTAAEKAIHLLVAAEKAVAWHEMVAKLGERKHPFGEGRQFNPHVLFDATKNLSARGVIEQTQHVTKGGYEFKLLTLPRRERGNARHVVDASGRRGAAMARYLSWTQSRLARNPVGAGLEDALRASLDHVPRQIGYQPLAPVTSLSGEVHSVAGVRLPGAVDNAAVLTRVDVTAGTSVNYWVLFEAKNLRDWIYPSRAECFQLLHKAAVLKRARPDLAVLPVLVARKVHYTTYQFAQRAGFFCMEPSTQFFGTGASEEGLELIKSVLGFDVSMFEDAPCPRIMQKLTEPLPSHAERIASRWAEVVDELPSDTFRRLRETMPHSDRRELFADLYAVVSDDEAADDSLWSDDE